MKFKKLFLSVAVMSLFAIVIGCGSGGGGGDSSSGSGTLSLALQDAFSESYKGVYVTIEEVQVCKGIIQNNDGDWQVVATPHKTYNLLDLVNGVREQLAIVSLEAGPYTQMRLIIGNEPDDGINLLGQQHRFANYVIVNNSANEIHELKIPSGFQTGIKIVHGFAIEQNETTELILDFDAAKSVVRAGASGQWLLKPTIKVLETASYSIVRGTVDAQEPTTLSTSFLQGALVSAQPDQSENPEVFASTISDEYGKYALFIPPGTYNIVGSKTGYDPACVQITTEQGQTILDTDLVLLGPMETGTVTGTASITGAVSEQFITISFRKVVSCGSGNPVVEVKSVNLASGETYSEELTPGAYNIRASTTDDRHVEEINVPVASGAVTDLNLIIP